MSISIPNSATELINVYIKALKKNKKLRTALTILFGVITLIVLLFIVFYPALQDIYGKNYSFRFFFGYVGADALLSGLRENAPILAAITGFMFFLSLVSFTSIDTAKKINQEDIDIKQIRQERKIIEQKLEKSPENDIVSTIQLNLNQLAEYYAINKNQARQSFGWSIFAIVAGLVTLIGGIWLFYFQDTPNIGLTIITTASSVLIEFIGGAYFVLYNKSISQLNFFYAQLVRLQDTMLSIKLMEDISDDSKQIEMREKLIMTLIGRGDETAKQ